MTRRLTFLTVLALTVSTPARAGLKVGDKAKEFKLFGTDYRYHSLARHRDSKAIVLVFWCNHCPFVIRSQKTLIALANEYKPKGVTVLAINSNPADVNPKDGFPQMIERANEKQYPFAYLYDETQEVARAYGATCTPHVFALGPGPERTVLYTGSIDNRFKAPHYLADALDDILAGKPVRKAKTAQFGCSVKWRKTPAAE